jgi:uncharacterized protein (TIGR02246 family)
MLACLWLTAAGQESKSASDSRGVTIRELQRTTNEWMKAYNANDAVKLASFYTEDADYVSPHVKGLILHGREQILQNFRRAIAGGGHLDSVVVERSGSSCDLAYLVCSYHATNSGMAVHGKNVLVMKKVGERWLIVTHASIVKD